MRNGGYSGFKRITKMTGAKATPSLVTGVKCERGKKILLRCDFKLLNLR